MEEKAPHDDEAVYVNGRNSVKLILISGGKKGGSKHIMKVQEKKQN